VGDWDGDGTDDIGIFRNRNFLVDYNANGHWDKQAGGDQVYAFGAFGDSPIVGDWNGDGTDDIGTYRPDNFRFYLDWNGSRWWEGTEDVAYSFRNDLEIPLAGDWDGDGRDEIGTWNPGNLNFYLDYNGSGRWEGAVGGDRFARLGGVSTDRPIIGRWGPPTLPQPQSDGTPRRLSAVVPRTSLQPQPLAPAGRIRPDTAAEARPEIAPLPVFPSTASVGYRDFADTPREDEKERPLTTDVVDQVFAGPLGSLRSDF
jgi:hypothetical protein